MQLMFLNIIYLGDKELLFPRTQEQWLPFYDSGCILWENAFRDDAILAVQNVCQIKDYVTLIIGKEVVVEVNKGRKKTIVRKGIVEKTYPFFFTLKMDLDGSCQRVSFNYVDILTKTVELEVCG